MYFAIRYVAGKKILLIFLFKTAECEVQMPALSPGRRAGCEDFPTPLQKENCDGSNQWLGNCWSIRARSSFNLTKNPLRSCARISCEFPSQPGAPCPYLERVFSALWRFSASLQGVRGCACLPGWKLSLPVWPAEGGNEIPVRMPFTFPASGAAGFCWRGRFAVVSKWRSLALCL